MDRTINNKRASANAANPPVRIAPAIEQDQPGLYEEEEILEPEAVPESRLRYFLFNPYLTLISRFFLGAILVISGIAKLGVPQAFTAMINGYQVPLPSFLVQLMAVALPPLELVLGILILAGLWTRFSAVMGGALMVMFLVAMTQAALRGLSPDCGCFSGPQSNPVGSALMTALGPIGTFLATETVGLGSILRDIVFLLMAVHLFLVPGIFSIDNWRYRHHAVEDVDGTQWVGDVEEATE